MSRHPCDSHCRASWLLWHFPLQLCPCAPRGRVWGSLLTQPRALCLAYSRYRVCCRVNLGILNPSLSPSWAAGHCPRWKTWWQNKTGVPSCHRPPLTIHSVLTADLGLCTLLVRENGTLLPLWDPISVLPSLLVPPSLPFSDKPLGLGQPFWRAIWQFLSKARRKEHIFRLTKLTSWFSRWKESWLSTET